MCGSTENRHIISVDRAPRFHVISPEQKLGPSDFGTIRLAECVECGHIFNSQRHQNSHFDGDFFITNAPISKSMIARHENSVDFLSLRNSQVLSVLDVGAGSGALAATIAKEGHKVTVVEPSRKIDAKELESYGISVISDTWPSDKVKDKKFDLILCVQVLEHIESPVEFLASLSTALSDCGRIYLEIPSGDWVVGHASIADIHLPHLSYFLSKSLDSILQKVSLVPVERRELNNGRDLGLILKKSSQKITPVSFSPQSFKLATALRDNLRLAESKIANDLTFKRFAIYGANAGLQALLGFFPKLSPKFIFDDTPAYFGASVFSRESRFRVLELTGETVDQVDAIIIAAYIHDVVISEKIRALGFRGEIFSIRPVSDQLGKIKSLFAP